MLSDTESNYKWTKTWAKPLKIVPCGYLGKLNNGFLYSFLGEQFVATMKSNSSKVAMTSHMLLQNMHFIPGGFWGLCVCYDTSGSWWFWMHAGRYVNVGTLTDGNDFASFATTITGEINDIKCPGRPPGKMSVPLWEQQLSELARLPPPAESLPCGWSAAASAQPAPASLGVGGFCLHSRRNALKHANRY